MFVQLNGSRKVIGVLRGYDVSPLPTLQREWLPSFRVHANQQVFLNIVLDEAVEEKDGGEKVKIGMVVGSHDTPFDPMCLRLTN